MTVRALRSVVPGPGLPPDLVLGAANNNLDAARHDGRLWLAVRTAPTHYASAAARLLVLVSDDEGARWVLDHEVAMGRDVREPRLVPWRGRLLLVWFTGGTSATRLEPDRIHVAVRATGWSEPAAVSPPDCIPWRIRPVGGRLLMTLYRGAGSLFTAHPVPLTVELWASDDGLAWAPADLERPVVHEGGAEADHLELPDGRLLAVVRKEGPEGGWGSDLVVAPADDPGDWRRRASDPRKFDSPCLFLHGDEPHLIARRQVAFGGRYDLGLRGLPPSWRTKVDQLAYVLTPKRTARYRIDPDALTATWLHDLPSAGDTAFAAVVPAADGEGHLVFNYSSRLDRGWWPWVVGQLRPTHVYSAELDGASPSGGGS
ncbi:MAG: exo-alpha-sialidase [Acidimicrobiales bacterium]|nr:exo-alpha-sialidase [Acidimicrobiales bacterium]HRW38903.1 sialidase family protein [Aquihabitans sp.]